MGGRRTLFITVTLVLLGLPLLAAGDEPAALDEALLGQLLETYVRSNASTPVDAIEVPSLARFALDDGEPFDVSVSAARPQEMKGWVPLQVAVSSEGKTVEAGVVNVHVDTERPVVVSRRSLRKGAVLRASDLSVDSRPESKVPDDALAEPGPAVGQRLTRSVAAGRPILEGQIEAPPVVKRGQQVRVELRHGRLRIESVGRAQEDARPGEWLRVRTTTSNREVTGQVDEDGVVHVSL